MLTATLTLRQHAQKSGKNWPRSAGKNKLKILFVPIKVASVTNNTILTFFDTHNLRSKNFVLESKCKIFMPVVSSDKMAGEPLVHTLIFYLPSTLVRMITSVTTDLQNRFFMNKKCTNCCTHRILIALICWHFLSEYIFIFMIHFNRVTYRYWQFVTQVKTLGCFQGLFFVSKCVKTREHKKGHYPAIFSKRVHQLQKRVYDDEKCFFRLKQKRIIPPETGEPCLLE